MAAREFHVTGMTCEHCELSVREEVGQLAGVDEVQVSALSGRLVVVGSGVTTDEQVLAAVDDAGYSAVRAR